MGRPECGCWLIRVVKGGPRVAARICIVETTAEPGVPDNDMTGTRSPFLAAFVLDEPVDIERVWHSRGEPITEAEFKFRCAEQSWLEQHKPDDPMATPAAPVNLLQCSLPF